MYDRTIRSICRGRTRWHSPAAGRSEGQSPFGSDWREAFMAFSMDKPLLGPAAAELLNVLETLNASAKNEESGWVPYRGSGTGWTGCAARSPAR